MPTTVTGTLRDSLGQLWTNAPVQFVFQPTASTPGPFSWSGGVFNPMPPRINTDANGFFTIVLPANNEMAPAGSYWQWIVGPSASYPAFVFNLTLATGALDVSPLFAAQAQISLVQSFAVPRAYSDAEVIIPPNMGQLYYDTSLKCLKYYENGQWNVITAASSQIAHPTSPTGVLTGVTGNPANPVPVVYFINANGLPDEKVTTITEGTKTFEMQFVNDTYTAANTLLQWHRTGYTADSCVLTVGNLLSIRGASSATVAIIDGTGNATFNGMVVGGTSLYSVDVPQVVADSVNMTLSPHSTGGIYLNWVRGTGVNFGNGASSVVGSVDTSGNATFNSLHIPPMASNFHYEQAPSYGLIYESYGVNTGNLGSHNFRCINSDGSIVYKPMSVFDNHVNITGDLNVSGIITAGTKAFRIPHPTDDTKDLIHGCLEGAEFGIYYRGEDNTGENSSVLLFLPHYFESLAAYEGRTVTLTQKFVGEEQLAILAASDVQSNSFTVRSSAPNVSFYWEVKAVRKDVSPLEVEPLKKGADNVN